MPWMRSAPVLLLLQSLTHWLLVACCAAQVVPAFGVADDRLQACLRG